MREGGRDQGGRGGGREGGREGGKEERRPGKLGEGVGQSNLPGVTGWPLQIL